MEVITNSRNAARRPASAWQRLPKSPLQSPASTRRAQACSQQHVWHEARRERGAEVIKDTPSSAACRSTAAPSARSHTKARTPPPKPPSSDEHPPQTPFQMKTKPRSDFTPRIHSSRRAHTKKDGCSGLQATRKGRRAAKAARRHRQTRLAHCRGSKPRPRPISGPLWIARAECRRLRCAEVCFSTCMQGTIIPSSRGVGAPWRVLARRRRGRGAVSRACAGDVGGLRMVVRSGLFRTFVV